MKCFACGRLGHTVNECHDKRNLDAYHATQKRDNYHPTSRINITRTGPILIAVMTILEFRTAGSQQHLSGPQLPLATYWFRTHQAYLRH